MTKVTIICGGTRGIGLNIVKSLLKENHKVYVFDLIKNESISNKNLKTIEINLINTEKVLKQIEKIFNKYGKIDNVVFNARSGKKVDFLTENIENFALAFNVMLQTPFFITQKIALLKSDQEKMLPTNMIIISSIAGNMIGSEPPNYHFIKSALNNMTKYIAVHGGRYKIKANAIAPGFIVQDEHKERFYNNDNKNFSNLAKDLHPLKEIGSSNDIVELILFIISNKANFINGEIITLDGALTVQDQWNTIHTRRGTWYYLIKIKKL